MRITVDYAIKRVIIALIVMIAVFAKPSQSFAQEQNCVQVYGGGVVCGAAAPEHKPVEAGLAENIALIGGGFILAAGVLLYYYYSRKAKAESFIAR